MIVIRNIILLTMLLVNGGLTRRENQSGFRTVGGKEVDITEVPWQVSLLKRGRHVCGGTIVDIDIIITAAHCVAGSMVTDFHIRAGSSSSLQGGQVIAVGDMIWHQDFTYTEKDNDIAILWLQYPLIGSDAVNAVMMMDDGVEIPDGSLTQVTGWGLTSENAAYHSSTLQMVKVPIVNVQVCSAIYDASYAISSRILCAGYPRGGKDACEGDSGGPMIYNNKLVGVVSRGIGCARPYIPGVYMKISALRKWLDYNISYLIQKHNVGAYASSYSNAYYY